MSSPNDVSALTTEKFSRQKTIIVAAAFILLAVSLYVNLGVHPLYLEEPRRALIALEMLYNKNLIVPTEMGEYYYKKPPLYNWVIIAAFKLFGNYSEFSCRFFSATSFLLMGVLIFFAGKRHVGTAFGVYSAFLFLICADIYYYFSLTGEIDLFYSLLTLAGFLAMFHFYSTGRSYLLFTSVYALGALGTITKGFPSIVFLLISLPLFFVYNRDRKTFFSTAHACGVAAYVLIVAGYFGLYARYNSLDGYIKSLWSQSSERTVLEKGFVSFVRHLFVFPLDTLKNLLPCSLLLAFSARKTFLKDAAGSAYIKFSLYILAGNIIVYWISPGTRPRYVYMLYPLMINVLVYLYLLYRDSERVRLGIFNSLAGGFIFMCAAACLSTLFIPQLSGVKNIMLISMVSGTVCGALLFVFIKKREYRMLSLITAAIVARLVFNTTFLPIRAQNVSAAQDKRDAAAISQISKNSPLYIYKESRFSLSTVFYIEREREEVLSHMHQRNGSDFFLADGRVLEDETYDVYYEFLYGGIKYYLVKFT